MSKEKECYSKITKINAIENIPRIYECIAIDIKDPVKSSHFKTPLKAKNVLYPCDYWDGQYIFGNKNNKRHKFVYSL